MNRRHPGVVATAPTASPEALAKFLRLQVQVAGSLYDSLCDARAENRINPDSQAVEVFLRRARRLAQQLDRELARAVTV